MYNQFKKIKINKKKTKKTINHKKVYKKNKIFLKKKKVQNELKLTNH